jgi:hypothetical protein
MVDQLRSIHRCKCGECRRSPLGELAEEHQAINRVMASLNEKSRRLFAGVLAIQHGRGGIERVVEITGLSRNTVRRGQRELQDGDGGLAGRVRRSGGGRQCLEKKALRW